MIDLSNPSAIAAGVTAVISVLLGGAVTSRLAIFLVSQKEFRSRIEQKRAEVMERLAVQHASLLNYSRTYDENLRGTFRGDGRNEPDLVGEYMGNLFKGFVTFNRLDLLKLRVRWAYWLLFIIIALGVVAFLTVLVFEEARAVVFWYSAAAVLLELGDIGVLFVASQKLEQYEDVP